MSPLSTHVHTPCTVQLVADTGAMIDGIMVEARENTSSFEAESTIWGTWVNDPNNFYHAVECNRSNTSSEGPFPVSNVLVRISNVDL